MSIAKHIKKKDEKITPMLYRTTSESINNL
jgi:hypothetical protein